MTNQKLFPIFGFVAGIIFTMMIFLSYVTNTPTLVKFFDLPQEIKA
ncbi:MAG: hypothetical protein IPN86_05600 [Saprospiraceae bacterium]|nr:hypothetical protein [Saprospiraceae bacterium]